MAHRTVAMDLRLQLVVWQGGAAWMQRGRCLRADALEKTPPMRRGMSSLGTSGHEVARRRRRVALSSIGSCMFSGLGHTEFREMPQGALSPAP